MVEATEYLSRTEAAQRLGLTVQRIGALSYVGRLGQRIAGHWVYTPAELDAYQQERAERPKGGRPKADAG